MRIETENSALAVLKPTTTPLEKPEAERLALVLQALADPTRLRILSALESVCVPVGAVVAATGLPQPTVSHHLRILRDRGLVVADRRGQQVFYCLVGDHVIDCLRGLRALGEESSS